MLQVLIPAVQLLASGTCKRANWLSDPGSEAQPSASFSSEEYDNEDEDEEEQEDDEEVEEEVDEEYEGEDDGDGEIEVDRCAVEWWWWCCL